MHLRKAMIMSYPYLGEGKYLLFLAHLSLVFKWDFWSFVVRRPSICFSVWPSVFVSVCKLFTFSTSSLEALSKSQSNLAQSILVWGFKFVYIYMTDHVLFQKEIITKKRKYIDKNFKIFLIQTHWISTILAQNILL